jgi:hypothetical protein
MTAGLSKVIINKSICVQIAFDSHIREAWDSF